ncbi:MAG TPA: WG repeat-containing protein [Prolixibacteraceae bacterium]|nr:WG repeat-containing protein [Prolixibacteraceae bacterium]
MRLLIILLFVLGNIQVDAQLIPFYSSVNEKYGYKDTAGVEVVAPRYDLAYPLTEGMAAVRVDGKYGYLDASGKEVVAPKYDFTWHFIGGYATVKYGDKYGFINKAGQEVIAPVYENANNFHGNCCYKGMAHVRENGAWKIIKLPE